MTMIKLTYRNERNKPVTVVGNLPSVLDLFSQLGSIEEISNISMTTLDGGYIPADRGIQEAYESTPIADPTI
jgi:hypothetical protein